jgi:uncharacterized protein YbaR (Trm112 family)
MESDSTIAPQQLDEWFLSLLACAGCEQRHPVKLTSDQTALICSCGKYSFPVTDGIPILLLESATVLDENADPNSVQSQLDGSDMH